MEIRMSGTIGSVLKQKGNEVWFITPDQSVYDAIEKMAFKAVGALLVLSGGKLVGIISERAFRKGYDTELTALPTSHLFPTQTTRLAFRRGAYLRSFTVEFIRLFAPHLRPGDLKLIAAASGETFEI